MPSGSLAEARPFDTGRRDCAHRSSPHRLHTRGFPSRVRCRVESSRDRRFALGRYLARRTPQVRRHLFIPVAPPRVPRTAQRRRRRGPARRGWAVSTIYTILLNEKYVGVGGWNKTRFLKDPDSGRRRPVPRPPAEWIRQDRPELRIVEDELRRAVQSRRRQIRQGFGRPCGPLNGGARPMYSRYLLTGLLRCAVCEARMRTRPDDPSTAERSAERGTREGRRSRL